LPAQRAWPPTPKSEDGRKRKHDYENSSDEAHTERDLTVGEVVLQADVAAHEIRAPNLFLLFCPHLFDNGIERVVLRWGASL
jgi:hypothetical protein